MKLKKFQIKKEPNAFIFFLRLVHTKRFLLINISNGNTDKKSYR